MRRSQPRFRTTILAARGGAFTLVELLIVLGIVVLLIALLLPAVSMVRRSARQVACTANLRQWATAVTAYASSNAGFLPRRGQGQQPTTLIDRPADWFNALPPMLGLEPYRDLVAAGRVPRPGDGGVWICPDATDVTTGQPFSYGMNMRLSTWLTPTPDRINRLGDLATMVFMADAPTGYCSILPAAAAYSPVARHGGRVNVAFMDGHVTSFAAAEVGCGRGDPLRSDVRWLVPDSSWNGPNP